MQKLYQHVMRSFAWVLFKLPLVGGHQPGQARRGRCPPWESFGPTAHLVVHQSDNLKCKALIRKNI